MLFIVDSNIFIVFSSSFLYGTKNFSREWSSAKALMDISEGIKLFIVLEYELNKYGDRIPPCGTEKLSVIVSE